MRKKTLQIILLWLFILQVPTTVIAQFQAVQKVELTQADGVPITTLSDGFEDSKGLFWFISAGELCRYDGFSFKKFQLFSEGRSSNQFFEDKTGKFWITSISPASDDVKFQIFDPKLGKTYSSFEYFGKKIPFADKEIINLVQNSDSSISVLTKNFNIYQFNGRDFTLWGNVKKNSIISIISKVSEETICCFAGKRDKVEVVFINSQGVFQSKPNVGNKINLTFLNLRLKEDQSVDFLFIGNKINETKNYLISILKNGNTHIIDSASEWDLAFHFNGSYFFKLIKDSVVVYSKNYKPLYTIPFKRTDIFRLGDSKGGVWFSSEEGILTRYFTAKNRFKTFDQNLLNQDWHTATRGITVANNSVFIAKGNVLVETLPNGKSIFHKNEQKQIGFDPLGCFMQKDNKTLWLGALEDVWEFDIKSSNFKKVIKGIGGGVVWQPYEDRKGMIWLGCNKGLYFLDKSHTAMKKFEASKKFSQLNSSTILGFYENSNGMWIASSNGIFLLGKNGKIEKHINKSCSNKSHISHHNVTSIREDENGWFWLSTKDGGLVHWDPNTGKHFQYTSQNGLTNDVIYACYLDDFNNVWMSSNNGLMQFDRKTKEVIYFSEKEGIPDLEFNTISHYKDKNGRLYFGGLKGAISFHPKDFSNTKTLNNPIFISSITKKNKKGIVYFADYRVREKATNIEVSTTDKQVTICFSLLNLAKLKRINYAYKIIGGDEEWITLKEPKIDLKLLPYGNYKLLLRAQAPSKPWQIYPYVINVSVLKPFYLQFWFILLAIILVILFVLSLFRWRTKNLLLRQVELEKVVKDRTLEISKQTEKLKALDELKTQFFDNIAHELRTPAALILGPIKEIQHQFLNKEFDSSVSKSIGLVERNAKKLLALIEEVLDLSRYNANKIKIYEEPVLLKEFLLQIKSTFESSAEIKNIAFKLDYQLNARSVYQIDKDKLEKVANNFISNALKFTANGGYIAITVSEINDSLLLSVEDNGIGLSKADIPYVFERFYQSKEGNLGMHGGSGIGLAICQNVAELLEGKVWVESELNKGSIFYFQFPKKLGNIGNTDDILDSSISISTEDWNLNLRKHEKTILLVEDNLDMQEFISSLFKCNYNILIANNGLEGLEKIEKHFKEIDLVISDVMMPLMDGLTMLQKMKENEDWRTLPVIILTARSGQEHKLHAFTMGVDDYIMKPFSKDELMVRIENLLENYKNRKLWLHDLLTFPDKKNSVVTKPTEKTEVEADNNNPIVSLEDLKWMKKVEIKIKTGMLKEGFDITELASEMALSKRQFERKTKKITGLNPGKLILEIRLQTARELLETKKFETVAEVCYAIGLETPSYFSKAYLQRFGKKPIQYLK